MISEDSPDIIIKILETALAINGATTKLMNKLQINEFPNNLKTYLSILENHGLILY